MRCKYTNIENIKKLLSSIPMLEETLQNCNFIIDNEITGVVTDGKDVYYNPKFMENKSSEQQAFAFANALCHIKLDTYLRESFMGFLKLGTSPSACGGYKIMIEL